MNLVIGMVLVLGVMILVHEWGHFVAARLCGVRVDVFSIGFGPRLFGWKRGATDYRVSAVPLGGYVRMAGQDLSDMDRGEDVPTGKSDEVLSKPRWQRAIIAFAGPAVNLLLPILLLTGFYFAKGLPYLPDLEQPMQVSALPTHAASEASPLEVGARILAINGVANPTWEKGLSLLSEVAPGSALHLVVEENGTPKTLDVPMTDAEQATRIFGYPPIVQVIGDVLKGKPAYVAGLRAGDEIVAVNDQQIVAGPQFVEAVKGSGGKRLLLKVRRQGQEITVGVEPQQGRNEAGEEVWQVGVQVQGRTAYRRVGAGEAGSRAVGDTVAGIGQVVGVVGKLVTGRVSVRQLQGVVGIARMSGHAVQEGASAVINLMAIISVNLGILNLLPIPILDGGQILLLTIEGTMRRDLSLGFKERFVQVGLVFLLVLFGVVMYNDVVRLLPLH
jgi:regulator of sigma E protease